MIDESKGCPLSLGGLFLLSVCICGGHSNTQWPKTGIHLKLGKPENPDRISVGRPFSVMPLHQKLAEHPAAVHLGEMSAGFY